MSKKVLILGAGFGGLELATRLKSLIANDVEVTLIDKHDFFILGFAKLEVLFGRKSADDIKNHYRNLSPGIRFLRENIQSIDPELRHVVTDQGNHQADVLVIALGADLDPNATPGLVEHGHEFYSLSGVERLNGALASFRRGVAMISILGLPYKCPPAPFEVALQLHDYLVEHGCRNEVTIRVLSPAPTPLPVSKQGSETILQLFKERGMEFLPNHSVTSVQANLALVKETGGLPFDLFMAVPVHRVPPVVAASGLVREGWISVNPANLETSFPDVYAIGDVTKIPVGTAAIPKAGAFADRAAHAVADDIVYRIHGKGSPGRFDGAGTCYLEFGKGNVAKIEANFLGGPTPDVRFVGPSEEFKADKIEFGSSRIKRWFGSGK